MKSPKDRHFWISFLGPYKVALPPKTIYTFIYFHSPKLWDATNFIVTPSLCLHPVFLPFPLLAWFIFIQHSQQLKKGTQITNIGKLLED